MDEDIIDCDLLVIAASMAEVAAFAAALVVHPEITFTFGITAARTAGWN